MGAVREWLQRVAGLVKDTATTWWRLAPRLIVAYALGWGGYQLSLVAAPAISGKWPWVALGVVSVGFVSLLSGMVVCLRILGHSLGVRDRLPEGAVEDDRDQSIARQLAITLLPFLGIYAVFGQVQKAATTLTINEIIIRGQGEASVLRTAHPTTKHQILVLVAVIVGTYVFRRSLDLLHEKTDIRVLGLVAALAEGFFMLNLVFGGSFLIGTAKNWLEDRRFSVWLSDANHGLHTSLHQIAEGLPAIFDTVWHWLTGPIWNALVDGFFQPVVWLAVAALVYGSHVLSLAEMWRKGEPLAVHLDAERTVAVQRQRAVDERKQHSIGRRVWLETQEAFFGDVDDKYLPTVQSLRLILRAGIVFLGAYCVVYSIVNALDGWLWYLLISVVGGLETRVWAAWLPLVDLVFQTVAGTIRLTLLAVAFTVALDAFRAQHDALTEDHDLQPDAVGAAFPAPTGDPVDLTRLGVSRDGEPA